MKLSRIPFDELARVVRPRASAAIAIAGAVPRDVCYLVDSGEERIKETERLADQYDKEGWVALARTLRHWRRRLAPHEFLVLRIRGECMFDIGASRTPVSAYPPADAGAHGVMSTSR